MASPEDIRRQVIDARAALADAAPVVGITEYETQYGRLEGRRLEAMAKVADDSARRLVERSLDIAPTETASRLLQETADDTDNPALRRAAGAAAMLLERVQTLAAASPALATLASEYAATIAAAHDVSERFSTALQQHAFTAREGERARQMALDETQRYLYIIGEGPVF